MLEPAPVFFCLHAHNPKTSQCVNVLTEKGLLRNSPANGDVQVWQRGGPVLWLHYLPQAVWLRQPAGAARENQGSCAGREGVGGGEVIGLTAWRKEEWRKEVADIPSSKVENDLCSTRQILALFWEQPWGDFWETGRNTYGPFRGLRCHLKLKQTETDWRGGGGGGGGCGAGGQLSVNVVLFSEGLHSELFTLQQSLLVALIYKDIDCVQLVFIKHFYSKSLCSIRITHMGSWKSSVGYNNGNNNDNNNNERICRVPVHVKHAQLRWTGANTKIQNTCMWDTQNSRCPIQIMLLKHPTKHKKNTHKTQIPYQCTQK